MNFKLTLLAGAVALGTLGSAAIGDSHDEKALLAAVEARQAVMKLYAFNVGQLAAMAKGEVEYDADAATAAASNLAALSALDQSKLWPPGSDTEALGDKTAALPAIWQADSMAMKHGMDLANASAALAESAGDGLDAMRAAFGEAGKTCNACHKDYRQRRN
ncbi:MULTISPECIES: c-type cytochrome [Halocynthiibacter]|uniref:Cytochrome c n=1 Tax=Halocynthiibacter halioticoli TaxID=2986804 RepID=A0AAE3J0I8_9RHOB|nr:MULTISPECIES: cytochrome c [Halocynthiibacter]MCV6825429.1 cytochrome c [Halocynthiibacter halioticoli]MCW4058430.1 cytochrome c [Halocynthiibacter sp. SDUM655004]